MRRLVWFAFAALAAPALLLAQGAGAPAPVGKPPIPAKPWPSDDVLLARRIDAQNRKLFQDGPPLEFTLTSEFNLINAERTPNNAKQFPGVLAVDGTDIPVTLGSRGHLRLKSQTCDFVPIKVTFPREQLAGTIFEGQTTLKLGTHCRGERESDQYVIREYLAYKLANLVTPLSFRARLARATYIDARSKKRMSTHSALFLEHENDVARRLGGREVRQPHMVFNEFDKDALTTTMLLEYMLGNTDYSIWTLHNVIIVQDKKRKFFPVSYDFDLVRHGARAVCGSGSAAVPEERHRSTVSRPLPHARRVRRRRRTVPRAPGRDDDGDRLRQRIGRRAQTRDEGLPREFLPAPCHARVDQEDICRRLSRHSRADLTLRSTACFFPMPQTCITA